MHAVVSSVPTNAIVEYVGYLHTTVVPYVRFLRKNAICNDFYSLNDDFWAYFV